MTRTLKQLILGLTLCFTNTIVSGQNREIDSLLSLIKTDKKDTNKVKHFYNLSEQYGNVNIYNKGLAYGDSGVKLGKLLNFNKGIGWSNYAIGVIYDNQGVFGKALENYFLALKFQEKAVNKLGMAASYNAIGIIYTQQGNYDKAFEFLSSALKIYEKGKNRYILAGCYNNIGIVYEEQDKYEDALKYYLKALEINKTTSNRNWQAYNYNNIGNTYLALKNNPSAVDNYLKSLEIQKEIQDIYCISCSYIGLGKVYQKEKQIAKAKKYFNDALSIGIELGDIDRMKESYLNLFSADSALGNYRQALDDYKLFILYRDSLKSEENAKKSIQTQMNYEFDKKEAVISAEHKKELEGQKSIAEEKSRKQKIVIWSVVFGLLIATIFSIFIFRSLKTTRKQKIIIENQKHLVEEKHKEITDSINYAERIQRSFLASDELLNQHLKNYFIYFKPKDVVSGDFYWADTLPNGNFILATADSTGHGVPGAIMSLLNITSLEKAVEHLVDPSEILNHTRQTIITRLKRDGSAEGGKDGMDCSLIAFDFINKQLHISAAYNPVWIVQDNTIIEIKPDKMPVGKHDKDQEPFTLQTIAMKEGDVIYTLTDGFPDQFGGEKGKKFMSKNLKELLMANSYLSMHDQKMLLDKPLKTGLVIWNKWMMLP